MMRAALIILILFSGYELFGQSAQRLINKGVKKYRIRDYEAALSFFNKAIEADTSFAPAYFNKGTILAEIEQAEEAQKAFGKAIGLDSSYVKAYFGRATSYVEQKKYEKAIDDLHEVVRRNEKFATALVLRGQLYQLLQHNDSACSDFLRARNNGDLSAKKYLTKYCEDVSAKEVFQLKWPKNEKWVIASEREDRQMKEVVLLKKDETASDWTEKGIMQIIKGAKTLSLERAMNVLYNQSKTNCPTASLDIIDQNKNTEHPWILFTTTCESNKQGVAESQLWYIVQGTDDIFANYRAIKRKKLSPKLLEDWATFFKSAEIVEEVQY